MINMGKMKDLHYDSDGFYPDEIIELEAKDSFESELDVRNYLKNMVPNIEDTDEMCHYDMETPKNIIEIKVRKKYYDKWLIEEKKYNNLIKNAKKEKKGCIYVVAYKDNLYWCDLLKLKPIQLEKIKMPCPKTTDFENNKMIDKVNYIIPMKKFRVHIAHLLRNSIGNSLNLYF